MMIVKVQGAVDKDAQPDATTRDEDGPYPALIHHVVASVMRAEDTGRPAKAKI